MAADDSRIRSTKTPRFGHLLALLVIVAGTAAGTFHYYAGSRDDPQGTLAAAAFGAPWFAAGVLALTGIRRVAPTMVVATAGAVIPISLVSIILWPVLIPASLLIVRAAPLINRPKSSDVAVCGCVVVGLISAFALLLLHQDPATWRPQRAAEVRATLSLTLRHWHRWQ